MSLQANTAHQTFSSLNGNFSKIQSKAPGEAVLLIFDWDNKVRFEQHFKSGNMKMELKMDVLESIIIDIY